MSDVKLLVNFYTINFTVSDLTLVENSLVEIFYPAMSDSWLSRRGAGTSMHKVKNGEKH
jgi:hypothetical protein